jgi:hypothetical protein
MSEPSTDARLGLRVQASAQLGVLQEIVQEQGFLRV